MILEANTNGLMLTHQAAESKGGNLWADHHHLSNP
jgi:hypothetical protein